MQTYPPPPPADPRSLEYAPLPPSPVHIYRARVTGSRWYWLLSVFWLAVNIAQLLQHAWHHEVVWMLWCIVVIIVMLLLFWSITVTQLIVTPDGITYLAPGAMLYAPWQEMAYIGSYRHWGYSGGGIVAPRIHWQSKRWARWLRLWTPDGFIPFTTYMGAYWQRGVGDEIRYYAPWLIETAPQIFE